MDIFLILFGIWYLLGIFGIWLFWYLIASEKEDFTLDDCIKTLFAGVLGPVTIMAALTTYKDFGSIVVIRRRGKTGETNDKSVEY